MHHLHIPDFPSFILSSGSFVRVCAFSDAIISDVIHLKGIHRLRSVNFSANERGNWNMLIFPSTGFLGSASEFSIMLHRQLDYIVRKGTVEFNKVSNSCLFCFREMQNKVPGSLKISAKSNHSHKKGRFVGLGLGV